MYPFSPVSLSPEQLAIIEQPLNTRMFVEGPAGAGKTTVGVERLLYLMTEGVRADSILLLLPQRTLGTPYYQALRHPGVVAGGTVDVLTLGGLAKRTIDLFWPLVAGEAGFRKPDQLPIFLTLETAQYYMARLVGPMLDQGYFESVTIDRNRLYSQILDNLSKAAVVGFPYTEIGKRLKAAWTGELSQARLYDDAQHFATAFRQFCLDQNLLDFALQLEIFMEYLWPMPLVRETLFDQYHHLLVDNLEEDSPVAHDLLSEWLPEFDSALLIYDQDAGYRYFLGADPGGAYQLRQLCQEHTSLSESMVSSADIQVFADSLAQAIDTDFTPLLSSTMKDGSKQGLQKVSKVIKFNPLRYHPEMLDWIVEQIADLVNRGVPPGEIVILAPYMGDALRFSLSTRLESAGIPVRSHRPSRALREEPAAQCLLTLAMLAHPEWYLLPTRFDVAYALIQAIAELDLVRAQLLAEILFRIKEGKPTLSSFDLLNPDMQTRITYRFGERYETLRSWMLVYQENPVEHLDHFFSRLFGEVLSQPGYGFHRHLDAAQVAANLVESAQKFRWVAAVDEHQQPESIGKEYVSMVQDGVVAAQYLGGWETHVEEAVLLAPAYTFLMSNRPVDYQFWLDVGGRGWFERLYQPLTHPHVLSRDWPAEAVWTDAAEVKYSQRTLCRLVLGLLRRCRRGVYLGLSELNEQGYEERGPLLRAIARTLRDIQADE
jgi:hypothetical protein